MRVINFQNIKTGTKRRQETASNQQKDLSWILCGFSTSDYQFSKQCFSL